MMRQDRGTLTNAILNTMDENGFERVISYNSEQLAQFTTLDLDFPEGTNCIRLVLVFTYPDDSGKLVIHSEDWINETNCLILREETMTKDQRKAFEPDADWRKNHAVIRELRNGAFHTICLRAGQSGDDQLY